MAEKDKSEKDMKETSVSLPLSRIKTIMKSSPEVSCISQDCLLLIAKATELFVQNLAQETLENSGKKSQVDYKDLAEIVNTDETLQFLQDIIPRKISAREYLEKLQKAEEDVVVLD